MDISNRLKNSNGLKKITMIAMMSLAAFALSIFAPAVFAVESSVSNEASPVPSPSGRACAAVITNAKSSSGECKAFPSPCDVPQGWTVVKDCSSNSESSAKPLVGDIKTYLEKMRASLKEFRDKKTSEDTDRTVALKEKLASKKKDIQARIDAAKKIKEEKRKEVLVRLIEVEIKHFNNTADRVAKMPNITAEIKAQLKTAIDSAVQKLNDQKAKVQAAASDEDVKTLAKETKDLFKTHREIVKKIVAGIHASKESSLISKAEERLAAIETKIGELKAQGKNVSELETILAAAKADIAAAKEKLSQKSFTEANDLLKKAYDKFKTIAEKAKAL